MADLNTLLKKLVDEGGSDLHILSGDPIRMRVHGDLISISDEPISGKDALDMFNDIMTMRNKEVMDSDEQVDFAYDAPDIGRFRVNVFRHLNGVGGIFRTIPSEVIPLEKLNMPPVIESVCKQKSGLILVTGKTGSGKSTTLASMINVINTKQKGHILTIEDPVEFEHERKNCLISQREVGSHSRTFAQALHSALREDPDAILVGELRDLETMSLAVTAAETGILVLATLHTNSAASTVDRVINTFPVNKQPHIRTMLSTSLRAIISQQLVKTKDGKGRVAAVEILINTSATSNILREGKSEQLKTSIQGGGSHGMQSMDSSLHELVKEQIIDPQTAFEAADDKNSFRQYLKKSS
ncbi:MAG: type IV pilus twitching motility protein PilT [Pseudomonadota bacterium]